MNTPNIKSVVELGAKKNLYTVFIDGEPFTWTDDDDKGFDLEIAITMLKARREKETC